MKKSRFSISTSHIIMFSFLFAIIVGSLLLSLPVSSATGKALPFVDALFTATSATCVTGLVTVTTLSAWSTFGHIVILFLIQIGGLGIITIMSGIMIAMNRKISMNDRLLLQDAFNLNSLSGLAKFVKKVILGTFFIEAIGALFYMTVFVPQFGLKGIWISFFNSISAFCNAGIDIVAENSLCDYALNPIINFVTCALIVLGGLGYIVWWDILRISKKIRKMGFKALRSLTLHSKIAIVATLVLIFVGGLIIFLLEYNNPLTIKNLSLFDKIQVSLFQSITTRTAGFATIPQENLTPSSALICILLMFIGGSPVGTAGGIKTVTIAVIFASIVSTVKNRNETVLFGRSISKSAITKALAVVGTSFAIMFTSSVLLSVVTDAPALDIVYETVSATATVGLTRNTTPLLNLFGKLIITATMYFGRIGPISLALAFNVRKVNQNIIKNPTEDISVG